MTLPWNMRVSHELPAASLLEVTQHKLVFLDPGLHGEGSVSAQCARGERRDGSPLPCGHWSRTVFRSILGARSLEDLKREWAEQHRAHADDARATEALLQANLRRGSLYDQKLDARDYKAPALGAKRSVRP